MDSTERSKRLRPWPSWLRVANAALLLSASATIACSAEKEPAASGEGTGFLRVERGRIVDGAGRTVWLRGVNLGTWTWSEPEPPWELGDESAFADMASMGMNVARLIVNHRILEEDEAPGTYKETGFEFIDQNVAWAKANGVRVILNVNVPPGGTADDCGNDAFWDQSENQDRLVALWRALGERYAGETAVAGYDLLDGPNPSESLDQWRHVAERLASSIREVDPHHILFVQRALSIACDFDKQAEASFVRLEDANVVYGFDRFQPWNYVAQLLESSELSEYGPYPDSGMATWLHGSWDSRPGAAELYLQPDEADWTEKRFYYTVTDPRFVYGTPVLQSDRNPGAVYFDDITIEEYDENLESLGVIRDLDLEDASSWFLWEGDSEGNQVDATGEVETATDGHRGEASVVLRGTTTLANLGSERYRFPVTLGHTYRVTGYMKGENSDPEGASMIRLDFWGAGTGGGGFNETTLESTFVDFVAWGAARGVPLTVNAFGAGLPTFREGRGGREWVSDMIDIMIANNLHFTYHGYHDPEWGIYSNVQGLPDPESVNQPLVDLLTDKLR